MAIRPLVALNEAATQLQVVQVGDVYGLPRSMDGQGNDITNLGTLQVNTLTAAVITGIDAIIAANSAVAANTAKLTANTANVTAAGALMDSELTSLSGVKTLTIPDNTTVSALSKSYLDKTTLPEFYKTLNLSKLYLAGMASGGVIGIAWLGQSNATSFNCEVTPAYVPNPDVEIYQSSTGTYPQVGPWGYVVADTAIATDYVSPYPWVGMIGTAGGFVNTNPAIEMADYISKATGLKVKIFTQHHSGFPISDWLTGGDSRTLLDTHMQNALDDAGIDHWHVMVWDQGDSDRARNYEDYVADGLTLRTYLETKGCDRNDTQWLIMQYSYSGYSTYWAGQEAFYHALGNQAQFISSADYDTSLSYLGIHFNGDQQRHRARLAALAALAGPSPKAPFSREMREMSWLRGARSQVANGASAVAYNLDTVNNLTTSGALLMRLRNAGVTKLSVDKDGNTVVGNLTAAALILSGLTTGPGTHLSTVADGASAAGHVLDTPAYATAGAKLLSVRNNAVEKAYIDHEGNILGLHFQSSDGSFSSNFGGLFVTNRALQALSVKSTSGAWGTSVANGASAVGHVMDTPPYTTAGAKLLSIRNNTVEKLSVDKDGILLAGNLGLADNSFNTNFLGFLYSSRPVLAPSHKGGIHADYVTKTGNYTSTNDNATVHYLSGTNTHTFHKAAAANIGQIIVLINSTGNNLSTATTSGDAITGGVLPTDQARAYQSNGSNGWYPIFEYA